MEESLFFISPNVDYPLKGDSSINLASVISV